MDDERRKMIARTAAEIRKMAKRSNVKMDLRVPPTETGLKDCVVLMRNGSMEIIEPEEGRVYGPTAWEEHYAGIPDHEE